MNTLDTAKQMLQGGADAQAVRDYITAQMQDDSNDSIHAAIAICLELNI